MGWFSYINFMDEETKAVLFKAGESMEVTCLQSISGPWPWGGSSSQGVLDIL